MSDVESARRLDLRRDVALAARLGGDLEMEFRDLRIANGACQLGATLDVLAARAWGLMPRTKA
jgi:hypothetical protein